MTVPVQSPDSVYTHTHTCMQVDMPTPHLAAGTLGQHFHHGKCWRGQRGFKLVLPPAGSPFPGQAWSLSEAGLGALWGDIIRVPSLARAPGTFRGEGNERAGFPLPSLFTLCSGEREPQRKSSQLPRALVPQAHPGREQRSALKSPSKGPCQGYLPQGHS